MRRWLVTLSGLLLLVPLTAALWLVFSEAGLQRAMQLLQQNIGAELRVAELQGRLAGTITMRDVEYRDETVRVHTDSIRLRLSLGSIISGTLGIEQLAVTQLNIQTAASDTAADDERKTSLPALQLPLKIVLDELQVDGLAWQQGEQHRVIESISASMAAGPQGISIERADIQTGSFQLGLRGEIGSDSQLQHALHTDWQLRLSSGDLLEGSGTLVGNLAQTQVEQRLQHPTRVLLQGSVSALLDLPTWQASVNVDEFSASDWRYKLPELQASLQFDIEGDIDASVLQGKGVVSTAATGQLQARYQLELHGTERLEIIELRLQPLREDSMITASGSVALQPALSWQVRVDGKAIDPASLYPDWPGRLAFSLNTTGRLDDRGIISRIDLDRLHGELREYPVRLKVGLDWQGRDNGHQFDLQQFDFSSGATRLMASGRIDEQLALDWSLQSPELSELLPRAQGRLDASGKLLGSVHQPRLAANIDGKDLAWDSIRAAEIRGTFEFDPAELQRTRVDLRAAGLVVQDQPVDLLEVSGDASKLVIKAAGGDYRAELSLSGASQGVNWEGKLQQADIKLGPLQQWQLQQPARVVLQQQALVLEQSCWQDADDALFCMQVESAAGEASIDTQLERFALQKLQPWLPPGLVLDAVADARATIRYQGDELTGKAALSLPEGKIRYPLRDGEIEHWAFEAGTLELTADDNGVQTNARLALENAGRLQAQLSLPGAALLALEPDRQGIDGSVQINFDDLGFVGLWLPEAHNVEGNIDLNLQIGGSLNSPVLNGRVNLTRAALKIPRLGLHITELSLNGQSRGLDRFDYQLAARSGDGTLQLAGVASRSDELGWSSRLTVRGQDVEVARIPEARVQASPDLVILVKPKRIEIDGEVLIPYARIEPRDLSTAARVSNDVIIIGEEQQAESRWVVVSRVRLRLGDRVHFSGYGFEGRLGGEVLYEDTPGQPTRASGEINVADGRYRAYGQRLDIQQGRLIFSGGPLSSPGLDVTAQRSINTITVGIHALGSITEPRVELFSRPAMGQTDILSYLLLGRPLENASSEEGQTMAKAALALGLSGGDRIARNLRDRFGLDEMRIESSERDDQASLVIGRYLTPRLYISYGIGLIETFNTFIVRYQVSDSWQLKASSGESHSTDLIYTIER